MSASDGTPQTPLHHTALHALHQELRARLVAFAGYEMPVHSAPGIVKEHTHVREHAGLFDVSHMGQARLEGPSFAAIAAALEALTPADLAGLKPGRMRYTQLLNASGGIIDDLMVTRAPDGVSLGIVANAARKAVDFALLEDRLPGKIKLVRQPELALLALQGPKAARVLSRHVPGVETLAFMSAASFQAKGSSLMISRSGYTGEDGFEISLPASEAEGFARDIFADAEVLPIGLGARDTLRLEAGLCLYGQDMDEETSPVEAGLAFSIGARRRKQGGFLGCARILKELAEGPCRLRVGLVVEGRAAARSGTKIADRSGEIVGVVTSGAFTPTANAAIAMGYVPLKLSAPGTDLRVIIRERAVAAKVVALPFVPHRYVRHSA